MPDIFQAILIFLLGSLIGIGIIYLSDVLPAHRKLARPGCTNCSLPFSWWKYVSLKSCIHCGQKRKLRDWIVLLSSPLLCLLVWFLPPPKIPAIIAMILFAYLSTITIIDLEHRLILHITSLVGAIITIVVGTFWLNNDGIIGKSFVSTLLGGAGGFGILFLLYIMGIGFSKLMSRLRKISIEEEAMGFGDVTLATVLGFLLGWPRIAVNIIGTILLAGLFSLVYILVRLALKKYQAFQPIPYGPFLIITAIVLVYLA